MYYTVYKITNIINGKFYIGKHQTKNIEDNYFGSGKLLKRAIEKYGKANFIKDIIEIYDEEWKMNLAERILVVPDLEINYNLCNGGKGGFSFINNNKLNNNGDDRYINLSISVKRAWRSKEYKEAHSIRMRTEHKLNLRPKVKGSFSGRKHSEKSKEKQRQKHIGENNSQFGTIWINNSVFNKKINKNDIEFWLEKGFKRGRLL